MTSSVTSCGTRTVLHTLRKATTPIHVATAAVASCLPQMGAVAIPPTCQQFSRSRLHSGSWCSSSYAPSRPFLCPQFRRLSPGSENPLHVMSLPTNVRSAIDPQDREPGGYTRPGGAPASGLRAPGGMREAARHPPRRSVGASRHTCRERDGTSLVPWAPALSCGVENLPALQVPTLAFMPPCLGLPIASRSRWRR